MRLQNHRALNKRCAQHHRLQSLEDRLREEGRSPAMVRKVVGSLGSLLADAQEQGLAARNPVRDLRRNRRRGKERNAEKRQKGKLKIGVDIPSPAEVKAIIGNVKGRWRPLLIVATFTGLRASELRGLRWKDIDLKKGELHVHQRADRFTRSASPSPRPANAWFPSESLSSTRSRNGSLHALRATAISLSLTATATWSRWPISSIVAWSPRRSPRALPSTCSTTKAAQARRRWEADD